MAINCATIGIEGWLGLAGGLSVVTFLIAVIAIPSVIIRLRPDYFASETREHGPLYSQHPLVMPILVGLKNLFGALLFVAGIVMLLTPGQGLLTVLIGLTLMDYPGKYRLERWLVTRRPVWRTVEWLRRKGHVPPFIDPYGHSRKGKTHAS